jgi:hypothetical protein
VADAHRCVLERSADRCSLSRRACWLWACSVTFRRM